MMKKTTLEQLDQKIDQQFDALSGEIRDFVEFVKENVAMKSALDSGLLEVRTELRSEIQGVQGQVQDLQGRVTNVRSEILTVADQVTKLQETVEIELVVPTRRMDRLERRVTVVERKLGLAT
jgi:chromosome segregation ATPase